MGPSEQIWGQLPQLFSTEPSAPSHDLGTAALLSCCSEGCDQSCMEHEADVVSKARTFLPALQTKNMP